MEMYQLKALLHLVTFKKIECGEEFRRVEPEF